VKTRHRRCKGKRKPNPYVTTNAAKTKRNPSRYDPTRTLTLRSMFARVIRKQFARLRFEVFRLIIEEDALGLRSDKNGFFKLAPTLNAGNPNQARHPAGTKEGGRFAKQGGTGSSTSSTPTPTAIPAIPDSLTARGFVGAKSKWYLEHETKLKTAKETEAEVTKLMEDAVKTNASAQAAFEMKHGPKGKSEDWDREVGFQDKSMWDAIRTRNAIREERERLETTLGDEARKDLMAVALTVGGGSGISAVHYGVAQGTTWTIAEKTGHQDANDFLRALVAPEVGASVPKTIYARPDSGDRAYYSKLPDHVTSDPTFSGWGGTVHVKRTDDTGTYVHEQGHHLENHVPGAREAAIAFRDSRVKGAPLSPIYGKPDELGHPDDWGKLFAPGSTEASYVGKHYPADRNTEIVSMGLELLYRNPRHFAEKDPEYFDFIMGILRTPNPKMKGATTNEHRDDAVTERGIHDYFGGLDGSESPIGNSREIESTLSNPNSETGRRGFGYRDVQRSDQGTRSNSRLGQSNSDRSGEGVLEIEMPEVWEVLNFNPAQPRAEDGKWTDGGGFAGKLKALGSKASHVEESVKSYVKDKVSDAVGRLPEYLRAPVVATFHATRTGVQVAFVTWTAGQSLAERVAKERGLSDEDARRLRGVLSGLDLAAMKPVQLAMAATGVGATTLGVASLIPPATASYLAYSTAKDPVATYRAAKGLVKDAMRKTGMGFLKVGQKTLDAVEELARLTGNEEGTGPNCGTGSGGFKPGNTCASGSGKGFGQGPHEKLKIDVPDREGEDAFDVRVIKNPTPKEIEALVVTYGRGGNTVKGLKLDDDLFVWRPGDEEVHHSPMARALKSAGATSFSKAIVEGIDRLHFQWDADAGKVTLWTSLETPEHLKNWGESHGYVVNVSIDSAELVASFLSRHRFEDWCIALLTAAIEETENVRDGINLAGRLYETYPTTLAANARWSFHSDPEKVKEFQAWLRRQLGALVRGRSQRALWDAYVREGFRRGAGRSFDDVRRKGRGEDDSETAKQTRAIFLESAFGQPVAVEKVQLLASRTFDELEGVTEEMATRMSRVLTDGMVTGKSPRQIASEMSKQIDVSRTRALTIARTEIIRAHAEGQLTALENLGVEDVGAAIEWDTTGDGKVCPLCAPLDGVVLKIAEARGMLPRHPNCRCAWIPAVVAERGQKRTQKQVEGAIKKSARLGDYGFSPGKRIAKTRPDLLPATNEMKEFSKLVNDLGLDL